MRIDRDGQRRGGRACHVVFDAPGVLPRSITRVRLARSETCPAFEPRLRCLSVRARPSQDRCTPGRPVGVLPPHRRRPPPPARRHQRAPVDSGPTVGASGYTRPAASSLSRRDAPGRRSGAGRRRGRADRGATTSIRPTWRPVKGSVLVVACEGHGAACRGGAPASDGPGADASAVALTAAGPEPVYPSTGEQPAVAVAGSKAPPASSSKSTRSERTTISRGYSGAAPGPPSTRRSPTWPAGGLVVRPASSCTIGRARMTAWRRPRSSEYVQYAAASASWPRGPRTSPNGTRPYRTNH